MATHNSQAAGSPKSMRLARDLAGEYTDALDALANGRKHHMASGLCTLDKHLPGWLHERHLIVIAGRPAMGKSAFAQQIAEGVAGQQRTTILFTLEMSGYEITERSVARRTGVPLPALKTADALTDDHWTKITSALAQFAQLPLLIDDASFDVAGMVNKVKAAVAGFEQAGLPPLGCIVVDYLQLVGAKAANRTLEVGQVTSRLKRLAMELSVPVIVLSQLNRGVESRTDKRPVLSDLRESGNIEQDADLVLFLYRDEYYDPATPDRGTAEVIAAKNRHGPTAQVKMAFLAERVMFGDLVHDQINAVTQEAIAKAKATKASTGRQDDWE